ncbi:MAG: AI-2E family transporter, partial [Acidimicrobiia bacterium]|nr:AI-2E family transporter [Acidimicrobiia bacterium]
MNSVVLTIRPRTIVLSTLVAGAVVLAAVALDATRAVLAELALAATLALVVRPGVLWLAKRTRMGVALTAVFIALVIGIAGLLGGEAKAISSGATQLQHAIPDRIERFQNHLAPENRLKRFLVADDVVARVRHNIEGIPSRFILGTESPAQGASRLGQVLLVASLGAFMVTQLPKTIKGAIVRLPESSRTGAAEALGVGYRNGGAYVRRTLVLSAACAAAGALVAAACGEPGAAVVGLWLGMWALVPKLGIVVGGLPLAVLGAGQGAARGIAAALALVLIVAAGEWTRRCWIERRTVTVGALLSLAAVMTGMELGRWPGALVALVVVAVLLAGADALAHRTVHSDDGASLAATAALGATPVPGADNNGGGRRLVVDIDPRSLALAGAVVLALPVAVGLVRSVPQSLTRLTLGVLIALALNPLVDAVQR